MEALKIRNLSVEICEVFDDFLLERNIEVPSSIEEMKNDGQTPEDCGSALYGMDFGNMLDDVAGLIQEYLARHGIASENEYEN